jgi:hypothetical protein
MLSNLMRYVRMQKTACFEIGHFTTCYGYGSQARNEDEKILRFASKKK